MREMWGLAARCGGWMFAQDFSAEKRIAVWDKLKRRAPAMPRAEAVRIKGDICWDAMMLSRRLDAAPDAEQVLLVERALVWCASAYDLSHCFEATGGIVLLITDIEITPYGVTRRPGESLRSAAVRLLDGDGTTRRTWPWRATARAA